MRRIVLVFVLFVASIFVVGGHVEILEPVAVMSGCVPFTGQRASEGAKAGCVLVRALVKDGTIHDVCLTVEDLAPLIAPLVDLLISEHKDAREHGARVAFALPAAVVDEEQSEPYEVTTLGAIRDPPKRAPRKRMCVRWVSLVDAGADAAEDASKD